ncbi:MAG: hypothetical protein BZ133_03530 [Methanosphaera sp. SHI613]|jgi:sporulation protein YlmC with PRC-barrel domain|nr:MAG: hypothetical protein BZ133_03530 [Methanosphaera sp. SHI613]
MKGTEIIGKKVIDVNAYEIGKISDVELDFENSKITKVYFSSNELSLTKHISEVCPENIKKIGDYVLLDLAKKEIIKEKEVKEIPDVEIVDPKDLEDDSSN